MIETVGLSDLATHQIVRDSIKTLPAQEGGLRTNIVKHGKIKVVVEKASHYSLLGRTGF